MPLTGLSIQAIRWVSTQEKLMRKSNTISAFQPSRPDSSGAFLAELAEGTYGIFVSARDTLAGGPVYSQFVEYAEGTGTIRLAPTEAVRAYEGKSDSEIPAKLPLRLRSLRRGIHGELGAESRPTSQVWYSKRTKMKEGLFSGSRPTYSGIPGIYMAT
jgi:hypothetical protein